MNAKSLAIIVHILFAVILPNFLNFLKRKKLGVLAANFLDLKMCSCDHLKISKADNFSLLFRRFFKFFKNGKIRRFSGEFFLNLTYFLVLIYLFTHIIIMITDNNK